ncbi:MMPL family transporter [Alphaproteobacteria bacterium]|nr:MMPL family transporter [Alphaproteobacteria bacterium]MDA8666753.1 MMPL family transporter [Alphaproteobacteria bacterium]MDA8779702.1 MMPL family transporter [Alphaproteobacteria bacterium]MDA9591305.1 MMPL family transporter [Alphaproteobacteria bacterium]MDB2393600.1 MMPL family transporter [Alphaproteobacteria bacterium]
MNSVKFRLAGLIIRHRALSLILLAAVTLFFAIGLQRVELRTIFSDLLPKNHPFVQTYKDHPNFGNPLTVTIMVENKDGDIYNAETLLKIWNLTRDIDLAPGVDHDQILSIATEKARYSEATPFGVDSQPLMGDRAPVSQSEIDELRLRVNKAPNARAFLISQDGSAALIKATFIERLIDYGEVFDYVQPMIEAARDQNHNVFVAGQPILTGWVYSHQTAMLSIFSITAFALFLALVIYMSNVAGVVTPVLTSVIAAIWGFGFVGWIGDPIEPLIMVVPLLLVARSFSHCVQFIERFYEIYDEIGDKKKAAEEALGVMMAPGLLGIVTDAAGLFLIIVAPIPAMERFAIFCGFWALILFPTNVLVSPLILSLLPEPKNVKKIIGGQQAAGRGWHRYIRMMLSGISKLSHGRRARFTAITISCMLIFSVTQVMQIKVGNPVEGSNLLWQDSEYNVAVSEINKNFAGLNTLEVVFEAKDQNNPSRVARQFETVFSMLSLQKQLEKGEQPPVATLSFADYLPEANRLFSGGHPKWAPIDHNQMAVTAASNAVMIGTGPKAFLHVTDFVQQNATVSLWYKDNKQETVDRALAQANEALAQIGVDHDAFRIRLGTGTIALQQSINDTVDYYQWIILGLLNLVILVTCGLAYRSVVAAVLLLIPVNVSNLFLGAVLVQMGIGLDVNTLPITAIGVGVGIDYGIYLLSRICEEYNSSEDVGLSIERAIATTGKAIFFTATIVLIAILPWYFLSGLKFLADMGLLLVMVMLINMLVALVLLPLEIWLVKPRFLKQKNLRITEVRVGAPGGASA